MAMHSPKAVRDQRSYGFIFAGLGFATSWIIFTLISKHTNAAALCSSRGSAGALFPSQTEDAKWLGPQKGDVPPQRLDSYKYQTNKYQVRSPPPHPPLPSEAFIMRMSSGNPERHLHS